MSVYTFNTFDDPSASTGTTQAIGVNDTDQIVGYYNDASGRHGYLLSGGTYTTLDDPSATLQTQAYEINNSGQIVGDYVNNSGHHGFLLSGGTYTTLDDSLATAGTVAQNQQMSSAPRRRPKNILPGVFRIFGYLLLGRGEIFANNLPFACCEGDEPPVCGQNLGDLSALSPFRREWGPNWQMFFVLTVGWGHRWSQSSSRWAGSGCLVLCSAGGRPRSSLSNRLLIIVVPLLQLLGLVFRPGRSSWSASGRGQLFLWCDVDGIGPGGRFEYEDVVGAGCASLGPYVRAHVDADDDAILLYCIGCVAGELVERLGAIDAMFC